MTKPIPLTTATYTRFIDNVRHRRYMVCWVYYSGVSLDVCHTHYDDTGYMGLSARGITYFCMFSGEKIEDYTLEELQKYIHSFIEVQEPQV